jgi:hypothetical protein
VHCRSEIIPKIRGIVGMMRSVEVGGELLEEQLLMTEKELRESVNGMYEDVQGQKEEKVFDIMIFREIRGQMFWN